MALRLNSLKTRMALSTIMIVGVVLVANAAYMFLGRRAELREEIEERATTFALLSRQPICEGYRTYYPSGFYKFEELIRGYLRSEPDIEAIRIVSVNGEILFDSADLRGSTGPRPTPSRRISEPDRLEAVKRPETTRLAAADFGGAPALELVAPYVEDWGRRKFVVLYLVHYRNLPGRVAESAHGIAGVLLLSILAAVVGTLTLTSRFTPVEAVRPPG